MLPRKREIVAGEVEDLQKKTRAGEGETAREEGDAAMARRGNEIDEDLHSRQLAVYGRETMKRLFGSNVLVSGLQGLGAEIAKNLVLAGVKSVTLHDDGNVELWDLSGNFFLSENDVGQNRAQACVQKLQELNNAVLVSALTGDLTKEHLSKFQAVVFTDISLDKAIEFDDYCHSHQPPIAFIKSEVRGLFGSVFCDFGPEFTVLDVDGEEPHTGIVASISNDNPALVSCVDDERLEFQDGDLVVFSEVHGMTELNDGKPRKVKNARPYSFFLEEDTSSFGAYVRGGIVTQVKPPKVIKFKPLKEAMSEPGEFLMSDFSKFERPPLLHLAFQALDKFRTELSRFPVAGSTDDVQRVIEYAISINDTLGDRKVEEIDKKLLHHFASGSRSVLNPMAAMFGGIVGQEVVKACSGKFHPLYQFFYFDSVESLPVDPLEPGDLKPKNSRYDAQISVFGSKLQNKLEEAKIFMVGSGALGCEFLKNLALMGISCSQKGNLTVTDDDVIEKSNLSRQFLFRDWNIGQPKSTVAATAAMVINPKLHVEALQNRASPETENVFNDAFWENLDAVVNALDNVTARMYIDSRCVYFQKPLLESGTLGAKCNTQMVIPHLTENYGASRDPPEKQAPMCTVHSFPHNIDHCLTWARSEFEGLLEKTPTEVNAFLSNPTTYINAARTAGDAQARDQLERVIECLDRDKCETFQDSITWARLKFEDYFSNRVKQLTFTFPEDSMTSSGAPFWSAPKRFPRPVEFSSSDPSQLSFILAAAILRAETFGIPIPEWAKTPNKLSAEAVDRVIVPDFQPKQGVKIVTDEKATSLSSASVDDAAVIEELIAKLEEISKTLPSGFHMNPIQFEKDDDTNFHMDVIAGFANMRARNYSIPEVDKLKAKFIAGRIIPAIATSTAMATGLVCLELYKALAGGHKVEDYRNTFANLAIPLFSIAEPVPPKTIKHQELSWTVWDRWTVTGNITLRELLEWLKEKGLNAYSISCGTSLLYNSMFPRHKERLDEDDEVEEEDEQVEQESSSSDDDEEEEEDDDDECSVGSDIAHYLMARHDDTPIIDKETHRLAVVNMDWDHIKAVDLYMVMTSCIPKGGRVLSVSIYPSEFGLKCMNIETTQGPSILLGIDGDSEGDGGEDGNDSDSDEEDDKEDREQDSEDDNENDNDSDEDDDNDSDEDDNDEEDDEHDSDSENNKLRTYELNRLRYYYAVVVCDSSTTANHLYTTLDGTEFLKTANVFDLQFISDNMEFKHAARDVATEAPPNYKEPDYETRALQHSKVKLTWDDDEPERKKKLRRKFNDEQLDDLGVFLASDDSESDDDVADSGDEPRPNGVPKRKLTHKERMALLLEGDKSDEEQADDQDMEVTFNTELEDLSKRILERKSSEKKTVWEMHQEKMKEKRKARKRSSKDDDDDDDSNEDGADEDEDFFEDEKSDEDVKPMKKQKVKAKDKEKGKGKDKLPEEHFEPEATKEELELLVADQDAGNGAKGYNIKRKSKKGKKGKDSVEDKHPHIDLTNDKRFDPMFTSHLFALDPTDPQYKRSADFKRKQTGKKGVHAGTLDSEPPVEESSPGSTLPADDASTRKTKQKHDGASMEKLQMLSAVKSLKRNLTAFKKGSSTSER